MDRVVASEVMRSGWIQDTYEEELMVSDDELDLQYKELPNINSFMSKWVNELLVVLFMEDSLYPNVLFQYLLNLNMFFLSFTMVRFSLSIPFKKYEASCFLQLVIYELILLIKNSFLSLNQ